MNDARAVTLLRIALARREQVEAELGRLDETIAGLEADSLVDEGFAPTREQVPDPGLVPRQTPDLRDLLRDPAGFTDDGLEDPVEVVSPCALDHRRGSLVIDALKAPSVTAQISMDPEKYWGRTVSGFMIGRV